MINRYYDPTFYICSEKLPFMIRIEIKLKEKIDGRILKSAAAKAINRYPYFAVKVVREGEEYVTVPNGEPFPVYEGIQTKALGSEEVGAHLAAISYDGREIVFFMSHVITDGAGIYPFVKTVLYYYICEHHGVTLDAAGINLAESKLFDDEDGEPFPIEKSYGVEPFYIPEKKEHFKLCDGGYVNDENGRIFRFSTSQKELMNYSRDHDGSPAALVSSLLAKAIWRVHPKEEKDLVCDVSFNMRPALGIKHNYRMLCSAIKLRYPKEMKDAHTLKLCTCTRGMIMLGSQPENALYEAAKRKELTDSIEKMTLEEKKSFLGKKAFEDQLDNTFSVSYVGKIDFGEMLPYIDSIYNVTDGSTPGAIMVEISAAGDDFFVSFIQGFSNDVYYKAFLEELDKRALTYIEYAATPLRVPSIELPE